MFHALKLQFHAHNIFLLYFNYTFTLRYLLQEFEFLLNLVRNVLLLYFAQAKCVLH